MLQVEGGQGGLDQSGGKSVAAGLRKILLHPLKQAGVCVTRACGPVEVHDVGTEKIITSG